MAGGNESTPIGRALQALRAAVTELGGQVTELEALGAELAGLDGEADDGAAALTLLQRLGQQAQELSGRMQWLAIREGAQVLPAVQLAVEQIHNARAARWTEEARQRAIAAREKAAEEQERQQAAEIHRLLRKHPAPAP